MFERKQVSLIRSRMLEADNMLLQVIVGARQTGKSTMLAQALDGLDVLSRSVSADDLLSPTEEWLREEWQQARNLQRVAKAPVVLILDEIQKISHWPNIIKGLWDADRRENIPLKVFLSGSSSLLLRQGLDDSLKGRFEIIRSPHWSFAECEESFGFTLDDFLFFGGFPGAAPFVNDHRRWLAYMRDSIIDPTISKDVLEGEHVRKPALLRALFDLGARFSAQELSYNKMLGQLDDAGNTVTLAHYLELLDRASVLRGLPKFHNNELKQRSSSPRLLVYDASLMTAALGRTQEVVLSDSELRGHLVETAVGAHLLAILSGTYDDLFWWRERNSEVDFVVSSGERLVAIEVKSGRKKAARGMSAFLSKNPTAMKLIVGGSGPDSCPLDTFLRSEALEDIIY